tara:strand:- start:15799 stop:16290 length:492 start_codon:yes stop_codon:yes gene_type:complete
MKFLVSIVVLLSALSGFSHPHHVSIATVTYNANTLAFEISLKTFSDDLEMALEKEFNSKINLDESNKIDSLLFDYLRKNISLKANTELKKIEFVGKEIGLNETFIYFQIPNIYMPSVIEVNSSFLLDLLDDQSNVFHFDCNGSIKSLFTRAYKTIDTAHLDCN